jgi:hypothetical protein
MSHWTRNRALIFLVFWSLLCSLRSYANQVQVCAEALELVARHSLESEFTDYSFYIEDKPTGAYIQAAVGSGGSLTFGIRTRSHSGKHLTDYMRAKELFDMMFGHLKNRIKIIDAQWAGGGGTMNTNVDLLNKYVSPPFNLPLTEAVKKTFTGERAVEHGFTEVRILSSAKEKNGKYIGAHVLFLLPSESSAH